jgi:hypothetical protein
MMLESGQWLGRGSVLAEGQSRGRPVECQVLVERDDTGATLSGAWQAEGEPKREFAIRLASNDVGTYTLSLQVAGDGLQGTAKLESPPNLGLVWNDAGSVHATFALFSISRGYGFRGFVRDASDPAAAGGGRVFTWEVAFSLKQEVVKGDNVVSLRRRR